MLTVKEIDDKGEIEKWLKWIFELPQGSQKQMEFRSYAMEVFDEAHPPDYKAAPGKTYYLVYKGTLKQLLVKLNWEATHDSINIAGMVRLNKGERAHVCLKRLIDEIRPKCRMKGKQYIMAKPISAEGYRALEKLSSLVSSEYLNNLKSFRYQVV